MTSNSQQLTKAKERLTKGNKGLDYHFVALLDPDMDDLHAQHVLLFA